MTTHAGEPRQPRERGTQESTGVAPASVEQHTPRRRSRGLTAQEAAAIAERLARATPSASVSKQRALASHWRMEGGRASPPPRGRTKSTTKKEAEALAARLQATPAAVTKQRGLTSQWEAAGPQAQGPAPHAAARLTTREEAASLAQRLPQQTVREARSRMLAGSWPAAPTPQPGQQQQQPRARPEPRQHQAPSNVTGQAAGAPSFTQAGAPSSGRDRIYGSHWSLSEQGPASSPASRRKPVRVVRPRGGSSGGSGTDAPGPALRVPTAEELRQRNRSSHFSLGGSPRTTARQPARSRRTRKPAAATTGQPAGRTSTPAGAMNSTLMRTGSWSFQSKSTAPKQRATARPARAAAVAPPAAPASARETTASAQAFRNRNLKSHWSIASAGGGSTPQRTPATRRKRAQAPPPPPQPPQPSAQARKRQALSSTWTIG